ncbi:MAG TPA: AMP-binding protein [Steroidobacteraceae bacterium]
MKTFRDMWELNRRRSRDLPAVVFGERRISHSELVNRASRLASALSALGLKHQDRVSLLSTNRAEWFDYYTAAEMFGFVAATVNFRLAAPEILYILNDCRPAVLIFEGQYTETVASLRSQLPDIRHFVCLDEPCPDWALHYAELLASGDSGGIPVHPSPSDLVRLLYTSGTTGKPKGVARSQSADLIAAQAAYTNMAFKPLSSCLLSMPMFHLGGQVIAAGMHWGGGTVHLHSTFNPVATLRAIDKEEIEMTLMAPVMLQQILDVPDIGSYDLSSLSCICYSAAPIGLPVLKRALRIFGPILVQVYAQTESGQGTALYACQHRLDEGAHHMRRLSSVGGENQFVQLRVVDPAGQDCPVDTPGEILIKSDAAMSYYWNNPAATAETLRNGWIFTGDIGKFDEDRFLYLVDRKKDVIISGGENIYCREVEEAIISHEAVREVAVFGVADEKWGESVKAIVILKDGYSASERELIGHCVGVIAKYKIPKTVEFTDDFPRLPSGKVHKVALREMYARQRNVS